MFEGILHSSMYFITLLYMRAEKFYQNYGRYPFYAANKV